MSLINEQQGNTVKEVWDGVNLNLICLRTGYEPVVGISRFGKYH